MAAQSASQKSLTLKIIWIGLTLSQFIYFGTCYLARLHSDLPNDFPAAWALAAVSAFASVALFSRKLTPTAIEEQLKTKPGAQGFGRVFSWFVICWALNELVTMMGLIRAFVFVKDPNAMLPFLVVGVLLNLMMFPRVEEPMKKAEADNELSGN